MSAQPNTLTSLEVAAFLGRTFVLTDHETEYVFRVRYGENGQLVVEAYGYGPDNYTNDKWKQMPAESVQYIQHEITIGRARWR